MDRPLLCRRALGVAAVPALFTAMLALACISCADLDKPSVAVKREQLFALGYGPAEDQVDLFQIEGRQSSLKTCLTMREGIFYIANGAGAKVVRYTSWGDPLSMIYNAVRDPAPIMLQALPPKADPRAGAPEVESGGLGRDASPYPFRAVGEIAVDSNQTIYVEDRLPPERQVHDKDSGALLDHVVLRFAKNGQFLDYLGQEGIGGTPFPYILGVYTAASDDCVVVSMFQSGWLVHWFDRNGILVSSLRLRREDLPLPDKGQGLVSSLDRILPDISGRDLILKVDYYRQSGDSGASGSGGADFVVSWAYRLDLNDGKYVDRWPIQALERTVKGPDGQSIKYSRVPALIGAAGKCFFFIYADDDGRTFISTYDRTTRLVTTYSLDIASDELYYDAYYLSPEGVLCALLATKDEAKVVWWRFDKLIASSVGVVK